MSLMRTVILVGQLGNIWSKSRVLRKVFQSVSVIGYFELMESMYGDRSQTFTIGDKTVEVDVLNSRVKRTRVKIKTRSIIYKD